jgi:hypothetical protein
MLVASLVALLVVGRGGTLSRVRWPGWFVVTVVHGSFALNGLLAESLLLFWPAEVQLRALGRILYHLIFLMNGVLDAVLPVVLLSLFLGVTDYRRWPLAGLAVVGLTVVVGLALGAARNWDMLLDVAQVLSFQAIVWHLIFFGLYLLKRLPQVDLYLAVFVAIDAIFQVLLPIQQMFFQVVTRTDAAGIWHLHQLLQLSATVAQVAIVLSCVNALRYRPLMPILGRSRV